LLILATIALAGCSDDGVFSPQDFFPGSSPTAWDSCDKFSVVTDQIQICASIGTLPTQTRASFNIQFALPGDAHVRIAVFDSHGALIRTLLNGDEPATLPGFFRTPPIAWDFTFEDGHRVPAGHYRAYFQSGTFISTSDIQLK
jgi:hypothetical protein